MSTNYLPGNDLAFQTWFSRFLGYLSANLAHFGLVEADVLALLDSQPDFDAALSAHQDAQTAARARCIDKDDKRTVCESLIRGMVARLQAYPATTNLDRDSLGIPVRGGVPTASLPMADNRPLAIIDIRPHLKHVLRIQNESDTGTKKAKPAGALGCEVWMKVGAAPLNDGELQYVGLATRNPFSVEFTADQANQYAHYRLRWVTKSGEKSDWGELDSATIAA